MKIGVDALGLPPAGGVRTSTVSWLKALAQADVGIEYEVFVTRHETELDRFPRLRQRLVAGHGTRLRLRLWAQLRLPLLMREAQVNLAHFMKNLSVLGMPCPSIVTIHDFNRFRVPHGFSKLDILMWRFAQPILLRRTCGIIAVSDQTKKDLIVEYGLSADKITVIHNGFDSSTYYPMSHEQPDSGRRNSSLPHRYVLYVGGLATHKNLYTLVRAFLLLKLLQDLPHKLLIVGGRYHAFTDPRVSPLLDQPGGEDVVFCGVVPENDLPSIYRAADLFVLPSLYEGFGLAPLEAMASGTPVIVTRRGALPEVVGDAGLYLEEPDDADELCRLMANVLTSPQLQRELRQRGLEQASLFSWGRAAQETLQLYRGVLDES